VKLDTAPPPTRAASIARRSGPTIDGVWAALPVLIPVLVTLMGRMVAIDLAYHVRAGNLILDLHTIPRVDTFSFSVAGSPWLDQQWGAQLAMALAHRAGGFATLAVLRAALIGLAFGLVYRACRVLGAAPRAASLLALAGFVVSLQTLAMRPQLFALPLFAAALLVVVDRDRHPGRLWWLPAMAAVWANLHGSFVMIPVLLGLAFVEDLARRNRPGARRLAVVGAASLAATCLTPWGPRVWVYAIQISTDPVIRKSVTEWAPITLSSFAGATFFLTAAAIMGWLALRGRPTPWPSLVWLGAFFFLTLPAGRGVIWWGLVAPVVVAGLMSDAAATGTTTRAGPTTRAGSSAVNVAVITMLVMASLLALPYWRAGGDPLPLLREAPQGLVTAAHAHLPDGARLLVPEPWGSWFEYALPSMPVFVDPRIELFPLPVWEDYSKVRSAGQGWQQVLDRWGVDAVVVDTRDWDLAGVIASDPEWRLAYRDADGVLYVRRT
jgi:hypothetical protein